MARAARLATEAMDEGSMQVFIRKIDGQTVALDARASDSVAQLMASFAQHCDQDSVAASCRTRPASRLVHGGFQLSDNSCSLQQRGIAGGSTLIEVPCMYGGGCDGGTTAQQRKFMRQADTSKKDVVRDQSEELRAKMHNCSASGKPLAAPIVACELGYIYNKEDILKMIATKTVPAHLKHVRKMRDLFALDFTPNPQYNELKAAKQSVDTGSDDRFLCPITSRPANGRNPFVALKTCGHVVSEQAHKQVGGSTCVVCAKPFTPADVVPLHPAAEVLEVRRKAMEEARAEKKKEAAAASADGKEGEVGADGKRKRDGDVEAKGDAKKAREKMVAGLGAGARVGEIHGSLKNSITVSAAGGTRAHDHKAKSDSVYASMFAKTGGDNTNKRYDAFWGQGAMAGVLGGR